jgi:hypothetical protein
MSRRRRTEAEAKADRVFEGLYSLPPSLAIRLICKYLSRVDAAGYLSPEKWDEDHAELQTRTSKHLRRVAHITRSMDKLDKSGAAK